MSVRQFIVGSLHLFALCSFAISQPIFDLLQAHPTFFVARRSQPIDLFWLVAALSLGVPSFLTLLELMAARLKQRLRSLLHHFFVAALAGVICIPLLKKVDVLAGPSSIALAIVAGGLFLLAYCRIAQVRSFLTVLSVTTLLFPALFVSDPSIREIFTTGSDRSPVNEIAERDLAPIIMVVFDELPVTSIMDQSFEIDRRRFPGFADLARDSSWYRFAHSVSTVTKTAIPAILTGNLPKGEAAPTAKFFPQNLFSWLHDQYAINSYEAITQLCPKNQCQDLRDMSAVQSSAKRITHLLSDTFIVFLHVVAPKTLAQNLPSISGNWGGFVVRSTSQVDDDSGHDLEGLDRPRVLDLFIDSIAPSSTPSLYFLHVNLPHIPWIHYPSGKVYANFTMKMDSFVPGIVGFKWVNDEFLVAQGLSRHLIQTQLADRFLGRLMEKLKEVAIYDSSLVMVTADHGVGFHPNQWRRLAGSDEDLLVVPLFVKLPRQSTGKIVDRKVSTIDLIPTISDAIGLPIPWPVDGESLIDEARGPEGGDESGGRGEGIDESSKVSAAELAARYSGAERIGQTFDPNDPDGFYSFGPYRRFGGLPTSSQKIDSKPGDLSVTLSSDRDFTMDPDSHFVPGLITGTLTGNGLPSQPIHLAAAVNGVFRVLTRSYRIGNRWKFSVLVPETSFRPGKNLVELFLVSERTDGTITFLPLFSS